MLLPLWVYFFKYSPKRQRQLEKSSDQYNTTLKDAGEARLAISKTKLRTVPRHSSMEDFDNMYTALCMCLEDIVIMMVSGKEKL